MTLPMDLGTPVLESLVVDAADPQVIEALAVLAGPGDWAAWRRFSANDRRLRIIRARRILRELAAITRTREQRS